MKITVSRCSDACPFFRREHSCDSCTVGFGKFGGLRTILEQVPPDLFRAYPKRPRWCKLRNGAPVTVEFSRYKCSTCEDRGTVETDIGEDTGETALGKCPDCKAHR
jgi:hypothetical protein